VKKTLVVALAVLFVLAFATPGLAQYMTYSQDLKADGDIQLERQAGHLCNTGAQWNQNIDGQGELTKVTSLNMVESKITVGDQNDFVTAIDAVRNLTVTSTIQLCAPPKQEYTITDYIYDDYLGIWVAEDGGSGVVSPLEYYLGGVQGEYDAPPDHFFTGNRVPVFGRAAGIFLGTGYEAGGWTTNRGGGLLGNMVDEDVRVLNLLGTGYYDGTFPIALGDHGVWWSPNAGNDVAEKLPSKYWGLTEATLFYLDKYEDALEGLGITLNINDPLTAAIFGVLDAEEMDQREVGDSVYTWGLLDGLGYAAGLGEWGENYSAVKVDDLTEQIWSVSVEADPGFSGNLHQKFEAAYGPYEGETTGWNGIGGGPPPFFLGPDDVDIAPVHRDAWGWRVDEDNYMTVMVGDDYVGNYFNIEQMARTSQGTVLRNIDISSPWSHAYFSEQSEIVGFSEVQESFAMINLGPGEDADTPWYLWFQ